MVMTLDPWGDLARARIEERRREAAQQRRARQGRAAPRRRLRPRSRNAWTGSSLSWLIVAALVLMGASTMALASVTDPLRHWLLTAGLLWCSAVAGFVAIVLAVEEARRRRHPRR